MISIKQANAFYKNWKENKFKYFNQHLINLMYEDANLCYMHREDPIASYNRLKKAMDYLFSGNYEEAEKNMFHFLTNGKCNSIEEYVAE